jgi:predicted nucleotidyltransferase
MLSINDNDLKILKQIFTKNCPNAKILAFGSRVTGDNLNYSDIDIAIIDQTITTITLSTIKEELANSNISILVDLLNWEHLPEHYQKQITNTHHEIKL